MRRDPPFEATLQAHATVTDICPSQTTIVVPDSGFALSLAQIVATNVGSGVATFNLFQESQTIAPPFVIGPSGTLFWDSPGGSTIDFATNSGLYGCVSDGTVEVTAYYTICDNRLPITKEQARADTYNAHLIQKAVRTPNRFGSQTEG